MIKIIFALFACILLILPTNSAIGNEQTSPVDVQEIFTSSKTIEGENFKYPRGKAEMRLIKVEVEGGATIPLHSHPSPLMGHIESGELTLTKDAGDSTTFKEGDSFVLAANTPAHTMSNNGKRTSVMWVAVASAEGIPTLNPEE